MSGGRNHAAEPAPRRAVASTWPRGCGNWALLILLLAVAAGLHVHVKLTAVQLGYALSQAARENRELRATQRELQVEVATLRSPRRLRKLALENMGLVERHPRQVIRLSAPEPRKLALGRSRP